MRRAFDKLSEHPFDVLVVGGGIHGAWTARAAAMRGLSVALVEAEDFASGTTSRSTMLAHGGLRYLAQFDVGLVREALVERGILTRKVPHLVRPLPFILPFYEGSPYPKWQLELGIRLYTWLARGSGYPGHRFLSADEVLRLEPGLNRNGLKGGALYYDGQVLSPERLTVAIAEDAGTRGACVANHASVIELTGGERVAGAVVRDAFTGEEAEVTAQCVLNTTGPFLDAFLDQVGAPDDVLRLTKGVHLLTPPFTRHAIVINAQDGRTFFAIPWNGYELVGTTDTDYTDDPRLVHATHEDVRYLIDSTREHFPDAPVDQVSHTNAGLRNLLNVAGVHPSLVTRRPFIKDHTADGFAGLYSLAGGKLTTARATASQLLDAARPSIPRPAPRVLDLDWLPGGNVDVSAAEAVAEKACATASLARGTGERLVRMHGSRWAQVLALGADRLGDDGALLEGEVLHAAREEAAVTVEDVLRRRTLAWASPGRGLDAADEVASLLAQEGVPESVAAASVVSWKATCDLHSRWRSSKGF